MAADYGISGTKGGGVMRIFIEPMEPLLFRTGRPFTAGENNFAETIFPPTPETLQGALRAMIAVQWGKAQEDKARTIDEIFNADAVVRLIGRRVKDRNVYGRFRIIGLTLGRRTQKGVEQLFPPPAHITQATVDEAGKQVSLLVKLKPESRLPGTSNIPNGKQLLFPELDGKKMAAKAEDVSRWLTLHGLRTILKGDIPQEGDLVAVDDIYARESRLGIGMNNATKTTEEGYLYQVQMIRMQPGFGFVVDIQLGEEQYGASELPRSEQRTDGLETPPELAFLKEGWLTLGGEQRAARFEVLRSEHITEEQDISQTKHGRLLYFATPAYFEHGWLPANPGTLSAEPITAAIHRYQSIGGWFLNPANAGGSGKITRRCVPAGSVYFFDTPVTVTQPLTDYGWQIGYGIAYAGER